MTKNLCFPTLHIGEEIRNRFDKSGLTQREFGARIGMSQQNVHRVFNNTSIDTKRLMAISQALQFNFFELFCNTSNTTVISEGNQSAASQSGDATVIVGDAALAERVRALESQLKDKNKIIELLESRQ